MNEVFEENLALYDKPNKRAVIYFKFNGERVIKWIFNFKEGLEDYFEGSAREYLPLSTEEEEKYIQEKREAARKRLEQMNAMQ